MLQPNYSNDSMYEIGIDEAGRGPLFGPLYVAAVICPKDISTESTMEERPHPSKKKDEPISWKHIKDSKKIKNRNKMKLCYDFITSHCVAYSIQKIEQPRIDEINIRQAVFEGMHACVRNLISQLGTTENIFLLVDGNDFKPFPVYDETTNNMKILPYVTIEGGDNLYLSIAAASILAKYTRDEYMLNLCKENPQLAEKYGLDKNMGYGTRQHMEGIQKHGITRGHRLSYKPCKL